MKGTKMGIMQASSVIITVMISHIILNMPNHLISNTGPSTILNLFYVFGISVFVFYLASKVFDLFPKKDLIDICEYTGGKWLKNLFSIAICIYFLTISGFVIRTFAESLVLIYFPNIDLEIVILIFVTITAIMNILGFKAISRVTLISLPVILISMVIIFISSASKFIPERALPILGYGAYDTFILGLGNIFAFSSMLITPFLIPYIGVGKKLKKVRNYISYCLFYLFDIRGYCSPFLNSINNRNK